MIKKLDLGLIRVERAEWLFYRYGVIVRLTRLGLVFHSFHVSNEAQCSTAISVSLNLEMGWVQKLILLLLWFFHLLNAYKAIYHDKLIRLIGAGVRIKSLLHIGFIALVISECRVGLVGVNFDLIQLRQEH